MNIQYTKEGKQIIDAIDELTSWDKGELISYLIYKLSSDELDKYLIENTDYIHADDIDYVRGVVDSNLMTEVLDEMDDYDILDYILNSFDGYANSSNLSDWMERMSAEDAAEGLSKIDEEHLNDILDKLFENRKETCMYILNYINKKLADLAI